MAGADRKRRAETLCGCDAACLFVLVLLAAPPASAQEAPQGWAAAWDFLVQDVCVDARDRPLPGISPLDGAACPQQRKLAAGERLPYHKRDWPGAADRAAHPGGYQGSDSVPVRTALGPAVVQTYDFGGDGRAFGRFDAGDGGQVAFFTGQTASFGVTEDGGAGLQLFIGPGCRPVDSWVIVDSTFATQQAGETLARITRRADRCPDHLGYAYTRWHVQPVRYRTMSRGQPGSAVLPTLVSEHFGGKDVAGADHLERMYFTRPLGYTRWERWQNLAVHDRLRDLAAALAASGRCAPGLGVPGLGVPGLGVPGLGVPGLGVPKLDAPGLSAPTAAGWVMVDCREWTQMVPPGDPQGDPPGFWMDRLRSAPATAALFAP